MLRDITDITINGGCFTESTRLCSIAENRFNIVYGRNGSGKSTIARAFHKVTDQNDGGAGYLTASVGVNLTDDDKNHIHVFNEDFIDRSIRIANSDSLDAIVMTGAQVGLDDQINQLEESKRVAEEKLSALELKIPDLKDNLNEIEAKITERLKNGGYADRGKDIKGQVRRINVSGSADVEAYRTQLEGVGSNELLLQINANIERIRATTDVSPIVWNCPVLPSTDSFRVANTLLGTALAQPKLDQHDSVVVKVAGNALLHHYLHEAKHHFVDEGLDYCPLCQRQVSPEFTAELMDRIAMVLDESTSKLVANLDDCIEQFCDIYVGILPKSVFENECNACELAVNNLNIFMSQIRESLDKKKNTPYEPSELLDESVFDSLVSKCASAFEKLTVVLDKRTKDIANRKNLVIETTKLNEKLACLECEPLFKDLDTAKKLLSDNEESAKKLKNVDIPNYNRELRALNARTSDTGIAMKLINRLLLMVFGGEDRLQLADSGGNGYKLLSHNRPVSPNAVSTGERNVIALAYFFAEMLRGQSERSGYATEKLVVIDDPVSSFDFNNRYGIVCMLTDRVSTILKSNKNSKVLFLTHDLQTLNDLVGMRTKLKMNRVYDPVQCMKVTLPAYLYLYNGCLWKKDEVKSDDYYERMLDVFEFADESIIYPDDTIGNQIRRLMESYLTFMYRSGIDDVLSNHSIMQPIPSKLRPLFNNLPARLMLNKLSHGQQYQDTPVTEYEVVTPEELHELARQLLIFIHYTNPNHLKACLRGNADVVKEWADELKRLYGADDPEDAEENLDPELTRLQKYYSSKEFTLADDGYYCYCESCMIPRMAFVLEYVGKKVRLINVRANNRDNSDRYPVVAHIDFRASEH